MSVTTDLTTDSVCEWLVASNKKFIRLNLDIERIIEIDISMDNTNHFLVKFNSNRVVNLKDVVSLWYRRGELIFEKKNEFKNSFNNSVTTILKKEVEICVKFFYKFLDKNVKVKIGSFLKEIENNKIEQLQTAFSLKLKIPKTNIRSSKCNNEIFKDSNFITKPIFNTFELINNNKGIKACVEMFNQNMNDNLSESTFPFLIQEKLNKKFEIRSFVCGREIYSMAIFSQKNEKTVTAP